MTRVLLLESSNIFTSGRFFKVAFHGFMLYTIKEQQYMQEESLSNDNFYELL